MGKKRIITFAKKTELGSANIGKHFFEQNVPMIVHFSDSEYENHVRPNIDFIKAFFKIEDYEGEIAEGTSRPVNAAPVKVETEKEKELRLVLEDGDTKNLISFIDANGEGSVSVEILKKVLTSLNKTFDKNSNAEQLIKLLKD